MKKRPGIYFYCPPGQALRVTSDPNPETAGTGYKPWTIFFYFPGEGLIADFTGKCMAFQSDAAGSKLCASLEEALDYVLGDDDA